MKNPIWEIPIEDVRKIFPLTIKDYNPNYKKWYEIEKQTIINTVKEDNIARINHIGSSAVDGLIGKPVMDISLEIDGICDIPLLIENLKIIGWEYLHHEEDPMKSMRIMFVKGYNSDGFAEKVYHMHVRYLGNWHDLYLRDYLIAHPDLAAEYGKLKLNIIKELGDNISILEGGYGNEKNIFLEKHSSAAKQEFKDKYKPRL